MLSCGVTTFRQGVVVVVMVRLLEQLLLLHGSLVFLRRRRQRSRSDQEVLVEGALLVARRQYVDDALREALHSVDAAGSQRGCKEVGEVLSFSCGPEVGSAMQDVDQRGQRARLPRL